MSDTRVIDFDADDESDNETGLEIDMTQRPKVLLCSVFGPYGVDDKYGRKENIMELFHNQVTREQGLFSLRFQHQSFGLYLIAENIDADTTILDFPSQKRFVREIKKGYDYVGISFIVPNFVKAKRMTELIRKHAPESKIVLGGHGTNIPGIEEMIDYDHICQGEGIRFFRELLGNDTDRPIFHPIMQSSFNSYLMGIPRKNESAVLMTGVGCPNACKFCCTSHFFKREYTPFLKTGREIFDLCVRAEKEKGYTDFFVMDENFLKYTDRAEELMELMDRHNKHYTFSIFSSAEAITKVGIDFMKRLGVIWLWLGMEGRNSEYDKNKGVDLKTLVGELRANGISVLGSIILFAEKHTKQNIHDDIDFVIDAGPDFIQFMQLGPLPGTALYEKFDRLGILRKDIPLEEWHGQHRIWFDHPHFTKAESEEYIRAAFKKAYDKLGSSLLRNFETNLFGYLSSKDDSHPAIQARNRHFRRSCLTYYPALDVMIRHGHNKFSIEYAGKVKGAFEKAFGPHTPLIKAKSLAARALAGIESARIATIGNLRQPPTRLTKISPKIEIPATETTEKSIKSGLRELKVGWSVQRSTGSGV